MTQARSMISYDAAFEPNGRMTTDQFLVWLAAQPGNEAWELHDGEPTPLTAVNQRHEAVVAGVLNGLFKALEGKPCRPRSSGLLVRVSDDVAYKPDAGVDCQPNVGMGEGLTYGDPRFVLEVLSRRTEQKDKGVKLAGYMAIGVPYVMHASADQPLVIMYVKQQHELYLTRPYRRFEDVIEMPLIGASLSLAAIYSETTFAPRPTPPDV